MQLENKIMLITYADSMGNNLKDLHQVLNQYYRDAVGGVHILPFFPSSADRGFAPMTYETVDAAFGTFDDVAAIGAEYYLMFDFMVNHISAHSVYFQDFLQRKEDSPYRNYFIRYSDFWETVRQHRNRLTRSINASPVPPISMPHLQMVLPKKFGAPSARSRSTWMLPSRRQKPSSAIR
jgi:sucrose phosphorylase